MLLNFGMISSCISQQVSSRQIEDNIGCNYKEAELPDYVRDITECNEKKLKLNWLKDFKNLIKKHGFVENDDLNIRHYVLIRLLHELITSSAEKNGSIGPILKVPSYFNVGGL